MAISLVVPWFRVPKRLFDLPRNGLCDQVLVRISLRYVFGAEPEVTQCTWPEIAGFLVASAGTVYPHKEAVPLWLPGATAQHTTASPLAYAPGALGWTTGWESSDQDPEGLWLGVFDFDDTPADAFEAAINAVKSQGPGLAHTTWQHGTTPGALRGDGTARGRIIFPLASPCPLEIWPTFWAGMAAGFSAIGAPPDGQCKNANRCYWVPCQNPKGPKTWIEVWGT